LIKVYDVTERRTFDVVTEIYESYKKHFDELNKTIYILVGNKIDQNQKRMVNMMKKFIVYFNEIAQILSLLQKFFRNVIVEMIDNENRLQNVMHNCGQVREDIFRVILLLQKLVRGFFLLFFLFFFLKQSNDL
jgi:GTPase SAR1 family protein